MKKLILSFGLILGLLFAVGCDNDDDTPDPVNESEVITTVNVTLTPQGGGTAVTLSFVDPDGEGSGQPTITVSGPLAASTTYSGAIEFLDETDPLDVEDITEEVEEEDDEHEVFYLPSAGLNLTFSNLNLDEDGNPLGTTFTATTGAASAGSLTVALIHEGNKPNDGTLADAGGETDVEVTFNLAIQ